MLSHGARSYQVVTVVGSPPLCYKIYRFLRRMAYQDRMAKPYNKGKKEEGLYFRPYDYFYNFVVDKKMHIGTHVHKLVITLGGDIMRISDLIYHKEHDLDALRIASAIMMPKLAKIMSPSTTFHLCLAGLDRTITREFLPALTYSPELITLGKTFLSAYADESVSMLQYRRNKATLQHATQALVEILMGICKFTSVHSLLVMGMESFIKDEDTLEERYRLMLLAPKYRHQLTNHSVYPMLYKFSDHTDDELAKYLERNLKIDLDRGHTIEMYTKWLAQAFRVEAKNKEISILDAKVYLASYIEEPSRSYCPYNYGSLRALIIKHLSRCPYLDCWNYHHGRSMPLSPANFGLHYDESLELTSNTIDKTIRLNCSANQDKSPHTYCYSPLGRYLQTPDITGMSLVSRATPVIITIPHEDEMPEVVTSPIMDSPMSPEGSQDEFILLDGQETPAECRTPTEDRPALTTSSPTSSTRDLSTSPISEDEQEEDWIHLDMRHNIM